MPDCAPAWLGTPVGPCGPGETGRGVLTSPGGVAAARVLAPSIGPVGPVALAARSLVDSALWRPRLAALPPVRVNSIELLAGTSAPNLTSVDSTL